jgi:hypothetical protein
MYLFPANSKTPTKYGENITVLRMMKWIERNVDQRIRLPEIPHIDLELQEDYYKKKAVLESYDENANKSDLEIDELINMDFEKLKTGGADSGTKKTDL